MSIPVCVNCRTPHYDAQPCPSPEDKRAAAVDFLRNEMLADEHTARTLREWIAEDPAHWPFKLRGASAGVPRFPGRAWHLNGGMAVRNLLRQAGFGEDYFGCHLDDVYVSLVEEALGVQETAPAGHAQ